jgi:hypothetical protein
MTYRNWKLLESLIQDGPIGGRGEVTLHSETVAGVRVVKIYLGQSPVAAGVGGDLLSAVSDAANNHPDLVAKGGGDVI